MSFSYAIREAFSGFIRTKLASIGSILTICIALLFLGGYYLVSLNAARLVQMVRDRVEVEAFCEEPLSRARAQELEASLLAMKEVERVEFVSKEEAARIFKREFGEDIYDVLEFNPLPPSFKIFLKDEYKQSPAVADLAKKIKSLKGIDEVSYRRDLLEFLDRRMTVANVVGLLLGVLIGVSSVFLVSNTIRLAIYAKRKMIQTMKLVGATRWFIRMPFLLEGLVHGGLGGILAAGSMYWLLEATARWISSELAEFVRVDSLFYLALICCGVLLGFFGSFISIRRFIGESVAG